MGKNLVFGMALIIAMLLFGCTGEQDGGGKVTITDDNGGNGGVGTPPVQAGSSDNVGGQFVSGGNMNMYFIALQYQKDQPEAILIEKNGKFMLMDAGLKETYNDLKAFLDKKGVKTIDVLLSTRSGENYSGALADVARDYKILKFIRPCGTSVENPEYETVSASIGEKAQVELMGEKAEYCSGKDHIREKNFNGVEVMLVRGGTPDIEANIANTYRVAYGNVCVLLPTNSNAGAQRELVNYYKEFLKCRIINVPDHGLSKTNVESRFFFTNLGTIKSAVITGSAADGTRHGRDTIATTLKDLGIKWFATYEDGTVLVSTDGNSYILTAGN